MKPSRNCLRDTVYDRLRKRTDWRSGVRRSGKEAMAMTGEWVGLEKVRADIESRDGPI